MTDDVVDILKKKYQGKKILIVGLGLQGGGVGLCRFFAEIKAAVTVTDRKDYEKLSPSVEKLKDLDIVYKLGKHDVKDFLSSDLIFKGPGVPWTLPELQAAIKNNIKVEMEMAFVARYFPGKIIGITGTRGKSTTTNLIFEMLKANGIPAFLGGGLPEVSNINFLKQAKKTDYLVAELSSWSLSGFLRDKISPNIAVFTNFYPDHLNYYSSLEKYLIDKKAIYINQTPKDYLVANCNLSEIIEKPKSSVRFFDKSCFPGSLRYLKGDHNLENASAAFKVSEILNLDRNKSIESISSFTGLPYRQQVIAEKNNLIIINDTSSTTPVATVKAIQTFSDRVIYLILGGNSKNLPKDELLYFLRKVEKIVLLKGSFTDEISVEMNKSFKDKILGRFDSLDKAVKKIYFFALAQKKPGYLLFSPAATSFASFNNEFHRGDEFNRVVSSLIKDAV